MKSREALLIFALILLVGCPVGGALWLRAWANPGYVPKDFDQQAWAFSQAESRGHMVDDLLNRHDIIGMTRDEVDSLLGMPDEDQKDIHRYRYHLGHMGRNPKATFLTEFSLLIVFGADGRATSAYVAD